MRRATRRRQSALTAQRAVRQALVVDGILQGKTLSAAAAGASISPTTARELLHRPDTRALLLAAMEARGLTPDRLADKLVEFLEAEKIQMLPDGEGGVEIERVPDYRTQTKAWELAHKVMADQSEHAPTTSDVVEMTRQRLKDASIDELLLQAVQIRVKLAPDPEPADQG